MTTAEQTAYEEFARETSLAPENDWDRYERWCKDVPYQGKGVEMLLRAFWYLNKRADRARAKGWSVPGEFHQLCEALEWLAEFIEREHQLVVPEW